MKNNRSNELLFFGGLGNQLFQLAFGVYLIIDQESKIACRDISARRTEKGQVDFLEYRFPEIAGLDLSPMPTQQIALKQWFFLWLLKFSSMRSSSDFWDSFLRKAKKIFPKFFRNAFYIPHGVGYSAFDFSKLKARRIVGAFHTYRFASDEKVLAFFRGATLKTVPVWLLALREEAKLKTPLILHIRRGDYLRISELGHLGTEYFSLALEMASAAAPIEAIWMFSDEPMSAIEMIPQKFRRLVKVIDFDQSNSAANLEAMRLGNSYIISNSTFSWWGAFLSYTNQALVIAPRNFFQSKPTPEYFYPPEWILI